jgi:hypothetical protein
LHHYITSFKNSINSKSLSRFESLNDIKVVEQSLNENQKGWTNFIRNILNHYIIFVDRNILWLIRWGFQSLQNFIFNIYTSISCRRFEPTCIKSVIIFSKFLDYIDIEIRPWRIQNIIILLDTFRTLIIWRDPIH